MAEQSALGNQNVQISHIDNSTIRVSINGQARKIPLEPALVPVGARVASPARLLRARAGVMPYLARGDEREALIQWLGSEAAFAGLVVGGRGGSGKTRLAVELCDHLAAPDGWLCGMLSARADAAAMEALADMPLPRLIVVDYAENRAEQLEVVVPTMAAGASRAAPVRMLLLVRAAPRRGTDWAESLRFHGDLLDAALDRMDQLVVEDLPFQLAERRQLFRVAADTFADRAGLPRPAVVPAETLRLDAFSRPLLVAVAAFLAVHGQSAMPGTREQLLHELTIHEDRYWAGTATSFESDRLLRERVVALATLAGADSEAEAVELLRLVPDLADASAERRGQLARWAHILYPGPRWWNPLEPDLLAEHLTAFCFTDQPTLLAGVLDRAKPGSIVQPLDTYARAAADNVRLREALTDVLTTALERLCVAARKQVATEPDLELLLGGTPLAAALARVVTVIPPAASVLSAAINTFPPRPDLILSPLALVLQNQHAAELRRLAAADPVVYEPGLAASLNNLSVRLDEVGRRGEGLAAIDEAAGVLRRLAAAEPAAYEQDLAGSLNNLSNLLSKSGRPGDALAAVEEAVEIRRRLAAVNPAVHEPELAGLLSNLSADLSDVGKWEEAVAAAEEAVGVYRRLVAAEPAAYEPDLAMSLNNLSNRLAERGRWIDGLAAAEEAVEIRRRLAAADPAAYKPDLAMSLSVLCGRLGETGQQDEALAAMEEAVSIYRRLAAVDPAAYGPGLANSLNGLFVSLGEVGRREDALAAMEEAVSIYRRLATADAVRFEPYLAMSLNNLSVGLGEVGRRDDALAALEEAVSIYRRLAAADAVRFEPYLALSLTNLSEQLASAGRGDDADRVAAEVYMLGHHPRRDVGC